MYKTIKDKQVPLWEDERVWSKLRCGLWILLALVCLLIIASHIHIHHRDEYYTVHPDERPHSSQMLTSPEAQLKEIICKSRHEDVCYYVIDADYGQTSKLRRLQIEGQTHSVLCAALLDSTGKVVFDQLWASYTRLVLQVPYILDVFKPGKSSNVLQIGLGGGTISGFLEWLPEKHKITSIELEPSVAYIARRWYNVPSTRRHEVIIADGIQFVQERSLNAEKYDFAIVDTSYEDDFHLMMSPVALFAREEFAANLRRLMNDKHCAFALNTYTHHTELEKLLDAEKFRHDTLHTFRKFFTTCFFVETGQNSILFCSCHEFGEMTQARYQEAFDRIPETLQSRLRVKFLVRSDW
ncbi:hypothetical protein M3Y98_01173500 [Aphelenchoides besseyi]|nr:hypothetical protein M3Y98_01173500 [Aphelenchoides besseyi]KAI6210994.1 hypothetical protein M3Y96_00386400 [Aphelenchoides besseyi]